MSHKILYLDDEIDLLEIFYDSLASETYHIEIFHNPKLALEAIGSSPPDIIFLDYRLPGVTGVELAKQIPGHIPKVLVTGELNLQPQSPFIQVFEKPLKYEAVEIFLKHFFLERKV